MRNEIEKDGLDEIHRRKIEDVIEHIIKKIKDL
jgi:hypothetical protein